MRGHRDLEIAAIASVLCALIALLLPFVAISFVFAAPLAFFLPGYAIASATFARRPIERPQLLLLSLGLSLATLALGSLILNYVPGGVRAISWTVLILLVVLNGCRTAALRRPAAPTEEPRWTRPRLTRVGAALLGATLLVTTAAVALAFIPVSAKHAIGYSELWIKSFNRSGDAGVLVGIGNEEHERTAYGLIAKFGGERRPDVRRFALDPGESQVLSLPTSPPRGSDAVPVVATLYRRDQPNVPYRRVSAWIAAKPGASR